MVKDDVAYDQIFSATRTKALNIEGIINATGLPREQIFKIVNTHPEFHETGGHYLAYRKQAYIPESALRKKGPPKMPYGPRIPKITPKPAVFDEMRAVHAEAGCALNNAYVVRMIIERDKLPPFEEKLLKLVKAFHNTLDMFEEETPGFYRMKR